MIRRVTAGEVNKDGDDTTKPIMKILYVLILATAITWLAPTLLELDVEGGKILYDANGDPQTNQAGDILCEGPDTNTPKVPCGGDLDRCKGGSNTNIIDCIISVEGAMASASGSVLDILKYVFLVAALAVVAVMRVQIPRAQYA